MIVPKDMLVKHGIVDSPRLCAMKPTEQLFFRNLLHVCDGAGRLLADADALRLALYGRAPGVQRSHVEAWLQKIYLAGLVKLYTRGAVRYGEVLNFGQKDRMRKVLYPAEDPGELNFGRPADELPDPEPKRRRNRIEKNRIEGGGGGESEKNSVCYERMPDASHSSSPPHLPPRFSELFCL